MKASPIILLLVHLALASAQLYSENFTDGTIRINCGGPNYTDLIGRVWDADSYFIGGKSVDNSTHGKSTIFQAWEEYYFSDELSQSFRRWSSEDSNFSNSTNSYIIPVPQPGTYWVRLFFCEMLTEVPIEDSFTIYLNGYKVREGYSVQNSYRPELLEWSLFVNASNMNITLAQQSGSPYINAIEIVPGLDGQYRERLSEFGSPILLSIANANFGADVYYVDGQGRYWIPNTDFTGSWIYNTSNSISGANQPPDLIPPLLYQSALQLNTSWTSQDYVSSVGYFLVRAHFAEIEFNSSQQRVMDIRIQGKDVLTGFDIFKEAGGSNRALHKDFAIEVNIDLNAIVFEMYPNKDYPNSILMCNGMEYFYIISSTLPSKSSNSSSLSTGAIVGIAFGLIIGVILIAALLFFLMWRRKMKDEDIWEGGDDLIFKLQDRRVRYISLKEIKKATDNFAESSLIGRGGFGTVYRGKVGEREWAIKREKKSSGQTMNDFINEVDLISQLNHVNLVRLLGFCTERAEKIFVYEFVSNSNVHVHLHKRTNDFPPLTLQQRLQIALGAARGLNYLHSFAAEPLIHRDVKTENILLDEKFQAKISDFGLLKRIEKDTEFNETAKVAGSRGYLDPEYYSTFQVSDKSDVYSFGVVLLELMSGRLPFFVDASGAEQNIVYWMEPLVKNERWLELADPLLQSSFDPDLFRKIIDLGLQCVNQYGQNRPSMAVVVRSLEKIAFSDKASNPAVNQGEDLGRVSSLPSGVSVTISDDSQVLKNEDYERMGFIDAAYSGQRYISNVIVR